MAAALPEGCCSHACTLCQSFGFSAAASWRAGIQSGWDTLLQPNPFCVGAGEFHWPLQGVLKLCWVSETFTWGPSMRGVELGAQASARSRL